MPSQVLKSSLYPWAPTLRQQNDGSPADPGRFASAMLNVLPTAGGYSSRRGGFVCTRTFASPATKIAGLFGGRLSSRAGDEFLVVTLDCYDSTDGYYQKHIVYSQHNPLGFDLKVDGDLFSINRTQPDYVAVSNTILFASPNMPIVSFSRPAGLTKETSIPFCSYLSYHKYRLFCGHLMDDPGSVAYSDVGSLTRFTFGTDEESGVFSTAGRLSLADRSDDYITGMSDTFYGDIYIFTRKAINRIRVEGTSIDREVVNSGIGCYSNHGICHVGNDIIWPSEKGIHSLITTQKYGDVESAFISGPIQGLWDRIPPENIAKSWAAYDQANELYMLAINVGQANTQWQNDVADGGQCILVMHVPSQRWSIWSIPATAITVAPFDAVGASKVVAGGAWGSVLSVGAVNTLDSCDLYEAPVRGLTHDLLAFDAFSMKQQSEWIDCGDPSVKKNFRGITVHFQGGGASSAKVYWQIDDKSDDSTGYRNPNIETFHLNPKNAESYLPTSGAAFPLNGTKFLSGINTAHKHAHIAIAGSGSRIRVAVVADSGHDFDLFGIEVHYIVESGIGYSWVETGSEVTVSVETGAKATPDGYAGGDEPAVPS